MGDSAGNVKGVGCVGSVGWQCCIVVNLITHLKMTLSCGLPFLASKARFTLSSPSSALSAPLPPLPPSHLSPVSPPLIHTVPHAQIRAGLLSLSSPRDGLRNARHPIRRVHGQMEADQQSQSLRQKRRRPHLRQLLEEQLAVQVSRLDGDGERWYKWVACSMHRPLPLTSSPIELSLSCKPRRAGW